MQLTAEDIKQKARELGADLVGIAPVSRWVNAPEMLRPTAHLPEARSVIALFTIDTPIKPKSFPYGKMTTSPAAVCTCS